MIEKQAKAKTSAKFSSIGAVFLFLGSVFWVLRQTDLKLLEGSFLSDFFVCFLVVSGGILINVLSVFPHHKKNSPIFFKNLMLQTFQTVILYCLFVFFSDTILILIMVENPNMLLSNIGNAILPPTLVVITFLGWKQLHSQVSTDLLDLDSMKKDPCQKETLNHTPAISWTAGAFHLILMLGVLFYKGNGNLTYFINEKLLILVIALPFVLTLLIKGPHSFKTLSLILRKKNISKEQSILMEKLFNTLCNSIVGNAVIISMIALVYLFGDLPKMAESSTFLSTILLTPIYSIFLIQIYQAIISPIRISSREPNPLETELQMRFKVDMAMFTCLVVFYLYCIVMTLSAFNQDVYY